MVNRRLSMALHEVQLSARGLWVDLYPLLQAGQPYGSVELDTFEIANLVNVAERHVRQAIWELREAGIIGRRANGSYHCPLMVDERKNAALREEIRLAWIYRNGRPRVA